nr:hypothetical protein 14 [Gammaproteobacteria bacterium]
MPPISFNDIPSNLRIPGFYIEFDNRLANNAGQNFKVLVIGCLLYTSDAADEEDSVDLGGGRIIKKKN